MQAITDFFSNVNHVYLVESIVILGIIVLLLYIFYALGIIKLPKK